MYIGFLNPQGNFDPGDSYWMEHPDFGGQLVYVKETALAMAEQDHRVDIITRKIDDPDWPEFSEKIDRYEETTDVRIVRIPCGPDEFLPKEQLWPYLGTDWLDGIIDFYEEQGNFPDAFTSHYGDGGLVGALMSKKQSIPYTFTGHSLGAQKMDRFDASGENIGQLDREFHFARRILAERVAMNYADKVITSTEQERRQQYSHSAYRNAVSSNNDEKFAVIPPGVNRDIFNPDDAPGDEAVASRIRDALARDIPESRRELPLIIYSSRLDKKKNHAGLVDAFIQNDGLKDSANMAIVVRGADNPLGQIDEFEGESRQILQTIKRKIQSNNLEAAVTSFPLNNQRELAAAYRWGRSKRSVFCLLALYEPFGLAPLEAMSCGLPVVVTNRGGPTESLVDKETCERYGVLVDPEDPHEVADGLLKLLESNSSWSTYQELGIERIKSRYTWKQAAKGYLSVIDKITESPGKSGKNLTIPDYFTSPSPENDIPLEKLKGLYFSQ